MSMATASMPASCSAAELLEIAVQAGLSALVGDVLDRAGVEVAHHGDVVLAPAGRLLVDPDVGRGRRLLAPGPGRPRAPSGATSRPSWCAAAGPHRPRRTPRARRRPGARTRLVNASSARPRAGGPGAPRARGTPPAADGRGGRSGTRRCRGDATRAPRRGHRRGHRARTPGRPSGSLSDGSTQTSTRPPSTDSSTRLTSQGASRPKRWRYSSVSRMTASCRRPPAQAKWLPTENPEAPEIRCRLL